MFDRSAADQAIRRYAAELTRIVACVTDQRLLAAPEPRIGDRSYRLQLTRPGPLRAVYGGSSGLLFDVRLALTIPTDQLSTLGSQQIEVTMYEYRLLDRGQSELLVYHFHPNARGSDLPHLHVTASLEAQVDAYRRSSIDLDKMHIVTGHVTLYDVVRMLITEFHIRPLRADWEARLAAPSMA